MNGISVTTEILSPFHHVRTQRGVCDLDKGLSPDHAGILSFDLQPPELCKMNFCCL